MRYQRDLRKANRRLMVVNMCLAAMVIIIALAFFYLTANLI